jgi:hypothetical protein
MQHTRADSLADKNGAGEQHKEKNGDDAEHELHVSVYAMVR